MISFTQQNYHIIIILNKINMIKWSLSCGTSYCMEPRHGPSL